MTANGPRAPGVLHLAIAVIVVVAVGAIAFDARQQPPPQVLEFAPQAREQITDAPEDQAATTPGNGTTSPTAPEPTPSATGSGEPPVQPSEIPRHRRCFGDPPRQTEDPQSPPCVPYWNPSQDNGGATWQGVTPDEIRVAWPMSLEKERDTRALERYVNLRFEFYGRTLRLIPYGPKGGVFGGMSAADMRAMADFVNDELDAFASIAYPPKAGAEHHYYDRLAEHRIVSVDSHASQRTEAHFTQHAPYEWGYLPALDTMQRNLAEWICNTLEGRAPSHAGPGTQDRAERVFGLAYHVSPSGSAPERGILVQALRQGCGIRLEPVEITTAQQVIARFVTARVTTVICLCQGGHYFDELMPEATRQAYLPEWIASSYHYLDFDSVGQEYPVEHAEHVFGMTFHNKWLPQKEMPWYQAIKEADPEYETGDDGYASAAYERYYELLVLASGIQMAGPTLTPENFQRGLYGARFPAKGSGGPPLWHPGGGFGPGDHTMVDDAAVIWWSPTEMGYTTNVRRGTFCYLDQGRRYGLGQWPRGRQPLFQGDCQ